MLSLLELLRLEKSQKIALQKSEYFLRVDPKRGQCRSLRDRPLNRVIERECLRILGFYKDALLRLQI